MNRRTFVVSALAVGAAESLPPGFRLPPIRRRTAPRPQSSNGGGSWPGFPQQDAERVREVVGKSHFAFDEVKRLVEAFPELAKASWDWGFGDWETALGAASHTGRREIAEFLLEHGARPTLFSAAMLGQVDVVRAFVEANPGVQALDGPHGITLLHHARAGGPEAATVVEYLEEVGGADPEAVDLALVTPTDDLVGSYRYGAEEDDALIVEYEDDTLWLRPAGSAKRRLLHLGSNEFHPAGAPSVRIRVQPGGELELEAGGHRLRAPRI